MRAKKSNSGCPIYQRRSAGSCRPLRHWLSMVKPSTLRLEVEHPHCSRYFWFFSVYCTSRLILQHLVNVEASCGEELKVHWYWASTSFFCVRVRTLRTELVSNRLTVHSRIARNARNFETWSAYQNCEEVSFSDIPDEFMSDVQEIFNTRNRISKAWLDKVLCLKSPQSWAATYQCTEACC